MVQSQLVESIIAMIFGAVIVAINCIEGVDVSIVVLGSLLFVVGLVYTILEVVKNKKAGK